MTLNILFVDDEENVLSLYSRLFKAKYQNRNNEYNAITSKDPIEALKILDNLDNIDVVLSDYEMPHLDGIEFLERVSEKNNKIVKILASSNLYKISENIPEGLNLITLLEKPFKIEEFYRAIEKAFDIAYQQKFKSRQRI